MKIINSLNSKGNKLILGCTGSGKSTLINSNFNNINNKKVFISGDMQILNLPNSSFQLVKYDKINFHYYLSYNDFKDYLRYKFNKSEFFSSIFFSILSEIKTYISSKFFKDILDFYKSNLYLFEKYFNDKDNISFDVEKVLEFITNQNHTIDLFDILNSNDNVFIYVDRDSEIIKTISVFLNHNIDNEINLIIDDLDLEILFDNRLLLINRKIKLILILQIFNLNNENISYFSNIFLFRSYDLRLFDILNTLYPRILSIIDIKSQEPNSFILFDNKKNISIEKLKPNLDLTYSYYKKSYLINSVFNFNINKHQDVYVFENFDYKLIFNIDNDYIRLISCYNKKNKKTLVYNLKMTTEHYETFFEKSYFNIEKDLLNILLY